MFDFSWCSPTVMQKKAMDQIKSTNVSPPFLGRLPLFISAGEAVDRTCCGAAGSVLVSQRSASLQESDGAHSFSRAVRLSPSRLFGKIVAAGMS